MTGKPVRDPAVIVLAKAPVAGRVKTRLCPPCTPGEACAIAEAALQDTLGVVSRVPVRRVLVLEGRPGHWSPEGFTVLPQSVGEFDERLAAAFQDAGGPALLIGMDTPQITTQLLRGALSELMKRGRDAVIGFADDGGWWAMGLRHPDARVFRDVPMGTSRTGRAQAERLTALGLSWGRLPLLRDVDTFDDAVAVAGQCPRSEFSRAVRSVLGRMNGEGADRVEGTLAPTGSI